MIGDNPEADVSGAERVGMHAILVRRPGHPDLIGATERIA
jgi:FMN phosphatase YigB (HAD superfamily)